MLFFLIPPARLGFVVYDINFQVGLGFVVHKIQFFVGLVYM